MSGKMRYSLQTWPRRAARAGVLRGSRGARRGAKTAGATPTTGCVTPPGGVGVERRRDILLIVAPSLCFGGAPAERGENPPISARWTRSWSFRRDGATISRISLRRSTPTPPGGVTQPVVGVVAAWPATTPPAATNLRSRRPRPRLHACVPAPPAGAATDDDELDHDDDDVDEVGGGGGGVFGTFGAFKWRSSTPHRQQRRWARSPRVDQTQT